MSTFNDVVNFFGGGGKIRDNVIKTSHLMSSIVTAAKIAAGAVTTTKLGSDAVTGPKLDASGMLFIPFAGHNGAGACTATGLKVGDKVIGVINITDSTNAKTLFETTITVADQIQQSSATDLSAKKFSLLVVVKS